MNIYVLINMPLPVNNTLDRLLQTLDHKVHYIQLYHGDALPKVAEIDWLIIMGGPMSAHDEEQYPWLKHEKKLIKDVIDMGTMTFGICLGAQLITCALGGKVDNNPLPELGWHEISPSAEIKQTFLGDIFNERMSVFHSHGETFCLPKEAVNIASTEACVNQGYVYRDYVVAIQFHPEITMDIAKLFVQQCSKEWKDSPYCQSESEISKNIKLFSQSEKLMSDIMVVMEKIAQSRNSKTL